MTQTDVIREATGPDSPAPERRNFTFAHASEAELARIFDFYEVRWEYEPHVFPLQWNLDGMVVESFTPDFFLPDLELYVELTTLRQPLVRKKNRKLRRLRELYPDLNVKLFYARDFRALMLKYGKHALTAGLSGSSGQVAAPYDGTGRLATDVADDLAAVARAADAAATATTTVAADASPSDRTPTRRRRPTAATKGNVTHA
jgi:hypoxanthine phosphoribosyltransferase